MGSLAGHLMPGMMFIVFGIWYFIRMFQKFYTSQQRQIQFKSHIMMDNPCLCGRLKTVPLEGFIKVILITIALGIEINTTIHVHAEYDADRAIAYGMHIAMYAFFGMAGIVDLLLYYRSPLPKDMDYFAALLAFAVEGLLLYAHLHGKSELEVSIHKLLAYVCFLTAISICIEGSFRHSCLVNFVRNYLIILQGTWFCHVGFILFYPVLYSWEPHNPEHAMIATLFFACHCGINLILMLLTGFAISIWYRKGKVCFKENDVMMTRRQTHSTENGQTLRPLIGDSDGDV